MGFSTFLGAIYTLAGVEESFNCGEGKGATEVEVGEKVFKKPRHRTPLYLVWVETSVSA